MQDYWAHVAPPLDVMYAAKMGWKPEPRVKPGSRRGSLGDLIAMVEGGVSH